DPRGSAAFGRLIGGDLAEPEPDRVVEVVAADEDGGSRSERVEEQVLPRESEVREAIADLGDEPCGHRRAETHPERMFLFVTLPLERDAELAAQGVVHDEVRSFVSAAGVSAFAEPLLVGEVEARGLVPRADDRDDRSGDDASHHDPGPESFRLLATG